MLYMLESVVHLIEGESIQLMDDDEERKIILGTGTSFTIPSMSAPCSMLP
jgi:hypothetical protein